MPVPARVLLYDAHPLLRRGLAAALADGPYDVCADTGDADDALALAERARPALAVVGVTMPSAVGLSLVRRLARSGVRVVVLAEHDEPLYAERALRSGARGYLGRDTEVADLHAALREVEAGGVALSAATTERLLQQLPTRRAEPGRVPVNVLSHREIEVFELTGLGLNRREIAGRPLHADGGLLPHADEGEAEPRLHVRARPPRRALGRERAGRRPLGGLTGRLTRTRVRTRG